MTEPFVEGNHPDAYDFRGNFQGNLPEAPLEGVVTDAPVTPSEAPAPAPAQVHPVASESAGYKAPGGLLRNEIRDRIRKVKPYSSKLIVVEEWDITVEVRSMTLGDRNDIADIMAKDADGDSRKFYPAVIIACTYDAEGQRIFTEEDVAWLTSLDVHVLDKIAGPAMDINGFGNDKKVDEEAGKSGSPETSGSASS